ncbi:hypothetical protein DB88DRAFT_474961 [Papiliotrema laurentii]|uniref:Uncharacterized protein n=1 Tax=Papiliotrema laurentii TaxID=5418 RepID=A0AAD9CUN3_PAPLA|nr:hypothetical protein DB88DRAFT_474961 [Papiliotrema laurentii]
MSPSVTGGGLSIVIAAAAMNTHLTLWLGSRSEHGPTTSHTRSCHDARSTGSGSPSIAWSVNQQFRRAESTDLLEEIDKLYREITGDSGSLPGFDAGNRAGSQVWFSLQRTMGRSL